MRRREPPQLATWMMEHLMPVDCREAVSGDLLEVYRSGRSDDWYWRQALTACALSWLHSLRMRLNLLVFVLCWSMLAPAWKVLYENPYGADPLQDLLHKAGFGWPIYVGVWLLLSFFFLWAGVLLFTFSQTSVPRVLRDNAARRAFFLVPMVFAPAYGITFLLSVIFLSPYLAHARYAATPLGQIADLSLLADLTRIPYFVALLVALWGTVPSTRKTLDVLASESDDGKMVLKRAPGSFAPTDSFTQVQTLGLVIAAGLVNAMIAVFIFCPLPDKPLINIGALLTRAAFYVCIGTCAGIAGSWAYWMSPWSSLRESSPVPFAPIGLACAASWVWVPAIMLYLEQLSWVAAVLSAIGASALAVTIYDLTQALGRRNITDSGVSKPGEDELFAESLYHPPFEFHGYLIAITLTAAGFALATRSYYSAALMLALSAFVFRWKKISPNRGDVLDRRALRRSGMRLLWMAIPAMVFTMWALLTGVSARGRFGGGSPGAHTAASDDANTDAQKKQATSKGAITSGSGYVSIILRAPQEKEKIKSPVAAPSSPLFSGLKKPLMLQFTGDYWYLQPPNDAPGSNAHRAIGSPLWLNIRSENAISVVMEARQYLGKPIRIDQCGEIDITLENHDEHKGAISIALVLTDGPISDQSAYWVAEQPVVSTLEPGTYSPKTETIRFFIPRDATIREFDGITLKFDPDMQHAMIAPKIAVSQLQFFPR